jgi:hypothetical protein
VPTTSTVAAATAPTRNSSSTDTTVVTESKQYSATTAAATQYVHLGHHHPFRMAVNWNYGVVIVGWLLERRLIDQPCQYYREYS